MLFLSVLFVFFTLIMVYKNPKSRTSWFICLVMLGWFFSPYGFILYLGKQNFYYLLVNRYFNLSYSWWNRLALMDVHQVNIIRLMNFGIMLFVYAFLCYAIAFTYAKHDRKNIKLYIMLAILPCIQLLIYDPIIYKKIYLFFCTGNHPLLSYAQFDFIIKIIYNATLLVNIGYLLTSILLLTLYLARRTHIPFIRNYTLFVLLGFIPIITIFLFTFSLAPKQLITVSAIADYVSFNVVDLSKNQLLFLVFRYLVILAFCMIMYATWKFGTMEAFYLNQNAHITKSIKTAHLGARIFSHALKNQLISIQGESEYLENRLQDNEALYQSAHSITTTCNDVIERLNELYDRFNIIDIDLSPTELARPVKEVIDGFSRILPPNIALQQEYEEAVPPAFIDCSHLKEVLKVLLNNAREAIGSDNGTVSINLSVEDNWSIIRISDTGIGMSQQQLKHIFEPFYTTKSSAKNWGIGLSYVHKIVSAHNGKIFAESKPGKGSTFKIILPVIL